MTQPPYGPPPNQPQFQPGYAQRGQVPPAPPRKQTGNKTVLVGIIAGVLGLGIGAIGASGDPATTTAGPGATVTVTATATKTITEAAEPTEEPTTAKPKPKPTKKAAPTIETTMEDGTYEIGVDAKPLYAVGPRRVQP